MEKDHIITKLKESLEKDYGDYGRTQYVIEKLQNDLSIPKSDHLYIERMIKLCGPIIEEPKKTITSETKKHSKIDGIFTIYQDSTSGKIKMAISEDQIGKEYIYFGQVKDGVL